MKRIRLNELSIFIVQAEMFANLFLSQSGGGGGGVMMHGQHPGVHYQEYLSTLCCCCLIFGGLDDGLHFETAGSLTIEIMGL